MKSFEQETIKAQLSDEQKALKDLESAYKKAKKDCQEKIRNLNARKKMNDPNLQTVIHQQKYQKELLKEIDGVLNDLQTNSYQSVNEFFEGSYVNGYVGSMYEFEKQGIPITTPVDPKKVVRAVQTKSKLSQSYYMKQGLTVQNIRTLKKQIALECTRGIASGKSWIEVADSLTVQRCFDISRSDAMRIVRTEGNRINQQGRLDAGDEAIKQGCDLVKQWDATLDDRTRPDHQVADGQLREWDEDFLVGGEHMKAPSIGGSAKQVINCRCQLLKRPRWALDEEELKELQDRANYFGLDKTKDFEEFKQKYLQIPDTLSQQIADKEKIVLDNQKRLDDLKKEYEKDRDLIKAGEKKGYSRYDEFTSKDNLILERDKLQSEIDKLEDDLDGWMDKNPRPIRDDFFPDDEDSLSPEDWEKCYQKYDDARQKWRQERKDFENFVYENRWKKQNRLVDVKDALSNWDDIEKYREANKIGLDDLRKRLNDVDKEQRELLRITRQEEKELANLKEAFQNKKNLESATTAFKTSGGEYKVYRRNSKLGDGTAGGYKRIAEVNVYVTPEGKEFEFPVGMNKQKQTLTPEQLAKAWEKVPEGIREKSPKKIQVLDYYNPQDKVFRQKYKDFTRSYATGGSSGVTFYRSNYHDDEYLVDTLCHEIGHVIDQNTKTASGVRFCDDVEWTTAMSQDLAISGKKSPTKYGENANAEDLAESVAMYTRRNEWFKKTFPNRTKILEQYILN